MMKKHLANSCCAHMLKRCCSSSGTPQPLGKVLQQQARASCRHLSALGAAQKTTSLDTLCQLGQHAFQLVAPALWTLLCEVAGTIIFTSYVWCSLKIAFCFVTKN
jgi:hypothetical protein